ncbi:MAG: PorT family protein [Sphingobacteriales bacterium]|nr:MAG: PorT family protein [Sphingobacteriales bacterium]
MIMRKLLFLAAGLLAAQAGFSQFHLGIKGGVNLSKVQGKSFKEEFNTGYHLGGFAEIGLGKKFAIQPEVLFNQYQTRTDTSFNQVYSNVFNDASSGNVKLNYLSVPILLNYKLGKAFALQAGPQFGVLLNKDENLLQNGQRAFKDGDFSMLGGIQLSLSKIRLQGRYAVGLNNINDVTNSNKWKSQAIQLSLGLAL